MKIIPFILALFLSSLIAQTAVAQTAGEGIDVTHYSIHIYELDFIEHTMQGETFVYFTATADISQIVLELKGLEVSSVTSTSAVISDFSQSGDFLTINLGWPLSNGIPATLDIVYGGSTFNESWGGVHWWGGDKVYNLGVGFESQPHNLGKTWFPCVDNFTDKATYDLFITATNDKKAICGGNLIETIDNGDGTSTWHWNTPQEIATYHISFIVADLVLWEDTYHGIERDIPIEVYTLPNLSGNVPATFVHIHEIAAFLEENLGPYPFNRIGYISTSLGCMEHTDNIALATSVISGNTVNEEYLAHELSHMWSGNLVTCADAGDMWLNEGFAQFWGTFYRDAVYGPSAFQDMISNKVNSISTWCNSPTNWMPLNNMPLDMTYNTNAVYERGAVIVNTMMNYMGRENFLSAMRQYFQQYAYQAATSENLRDALTQYSGIDMNGFFDTYVFSSGMPHLYATITSVTPVGNQFEVQLDLRYQHIGDMHIGQTNVYEVTFIGPDFQLVTEKVTWDGLHGSAIVFLDFEPLGMANDLNNNWLDGKTQKNLMLKSTTSQNFAYVTAQVESLTDSVFVSIENHFVGPYDDPLIPYLNLSSKHFWTINRFDFGEAKVTGMIDFSKSFDGDIIHTQNDSAVLLYRANSAEPWHEIPYTLYPGSSWKQGRFILEDLMPGEYTIAAWDKEAMGFEEFSQSERVMQLFPNPTENQVQVTWNGIADGQLCLCDLNGKLLKRIDFSQTECLILSLEGLAKGWYIVERIDKNGLVVEQRKLIVK